MTDLASNAGFQGVKTTLRLIVRATDVFPLQTCFIDIVEVRDFQLKCCDSVVMVLTVPKQPLRTYKIAKIWDRS